ncbi:MAG: histidine--tRNA ligase [Fimbriimonadales bacterium]
MKPKYFAPKGTEDILPTVSHEWRFVENHWRTVCERYGYREIRTPIYEETELFRRGVGTETDIVSKEMFTFRDRGERDLALKPEGTAPVVRAYIEHGLYAQSQLQRLYYITPFFRDEDVQKGRYRQAHQMGAELIGSAEPYADAELLSMLVYFFRTLGIPEDWFELHLNTMGCPECRPAYREAVQQFGQRHRDQLCETCQHRLERNPLRILDCKVPTCRAITEDAPRIDPFLCEACRTHFEQLQEVLKALGVAYVRDHRLVRGLDYYTRTTFEVLAKGLGAQNALCGGGRYDGLVEQLGGNPTPALGVGIGLERTLMVLRELGASLPEPPHPDLFIVAFGDSARLPALQLAEQLRHAGFATDLDITGRSPKAQMRLANDSRAHFALLIGEDELATQSVTVRNLQTREQRTVPQNQLIEWLSQHLPRR